MPDLFITCPQTTLPSGLVVPSFQVGQYACTRGEDGKAAVTADAAPWVTINFHEARAACEKSGYQLITETQWLALARGLAWAKEMRGYENKKAGIEKGVKGKKEENA